MTRLHTSPPRSPRARRGLAALILFAAVLCPLAAAGASAQSGRRKPPPLSPAPAPAKDAEPEGESESVPRESGKKPTDVLISFAVMEYDNPIVGVDFMTRGGVIDSFVRRLGQSRAVSVTRAGKGGRREAREQAKKEQETYVVLFELEEEAAGSGRGSVGRVDSRTLIIKTYVYEPKSGNLKFTDTIFQRPYRSTTTVGGIPIPVPTRRVERYPSQLELEQAARDAADRLMSRFNVIAPPDN